MPAPTRRPHIFSLAVDRIPQDPIAHLAHLWKAFEEAGTISAYIAYRMHLAQLARENRMVGPRAQRDLQ